MAKHLEHMARRLEGDPFFLACPLELYAKSEGLDEEGLSAALKCSKESLLKARLCRSPAAEAETFQDDIRLIATRFSLDADALAVAVRRGQAIFHMTESGKATRTLLAARDGDSKADSDRKEGDTR
jgi:hypothetical protein